MGLFSFTAPKKGGKGADAAKARVKKDAPAAKSAPRAKAVSPEAAPKTSAAAPARASSGKAELAYRTLIAPRITEKASVLAERNVYVFEVAENATKPEIARAVKELYKVSPVHIAIVRTPVKYVRLRSRRGVGTKGGVKKAYVHLKAGDKIETV